MAAQRIIIVDDHPLFRGALAQALVSSLKGVQIQEAGSLDELTEKLTISSDVDLVLLDLSMPGVQGLSGLLFLQAQHPEIPVVIVSASEDPGTIRRALEFGASGYVPKSLPVEEIRGAVAKVLDGEIWSPPGVELGKAADPGCSTSRSPTSSVSRRPRSRPTCPRSCKSSASTVAPRRSSQSARSVRPSGRSRKPPSASDPELHALRSTVRRTIYDRWSGIVCPSPFGRSTGIDLPVTM